MDQAPSLDLLTLVLAITCLVAVIVLPAALRGIQGTLTAFEPVVILAIGFLLYFVVGPVVSLTTDQTEYLGRDFRPVYIQGFLGVAASTAFMWVGYALRTGPRLGRWAARKLAANASQDSAARQRVMMRQGGTALVIGGAVGLASSFIFGRGSVESVLLPGVLSAPGQRLETTSTLNYLFLMMEWFIPGYLMLLSARVFRRRWVGIVLAASILTIYVSIGFRFRIVIFVLAIATLKGAAKSIRRPATLLLTGGLVVLLLAGYVGSTRFYFRSGGTVGTAAPGQDVIIASAHSETRIFDAYAAVLDAVPARLDHAGLAPLVSVITLPIPRGLWSTKPSPDYLQTISEAIGGQEARFAGPAIPNFGEYYLAFGWFGVFLGMVLFGIGARALWEYWLASDGDPFALVVYACSLPFLLQIVSRGYTAQIVQEWFFTVFPAVFVARRAKKRLLSIETITPERSSTPQPLVGPS